MCLLRASGEQAHSAASLGHRVRRESSRRQAYTHYSRRLAGEVTGAFSTAKSLVIVAAAIGLGT